MRNLSINILHQQLQEVLPYCLKNDLGIEVDDFAVPYYLDNSRDEIIKLYSSKLKVVKAISSHGPFQGLYTNCIDSEIQKVCRKRHITAIDSSTAIGASIYVIHLNYQPMIKSPDYIDNFIERSLDFWLPILDYAKSKNIKIVTENMWEPTPELQLQFIEKANHPNLKASFDNGHALVFSQINSSSWIKKLSPHLIHCHLHDNHGQMDEHNEIGNGKENWNGLFHELNKIDNLRIILESGSFEKQKQSLNYINENKLYKNLGD